MSRELIGILSVALLERAQVRSIDSSPESHVMSKKEKK